jgi:hypothetical protein
MNTIEPADCSKAEFVDEFQPRQKGPAFRHQYDRLILKKDTKLREKERKKRKEK